MTRRTESWVLAPHVRAIAVGAACVGAIAAAAVGAIVSAPDTAPVSVPVSAPAKAYSAGWDSAMATQAGGMPELHGVVKLAVTTPCAYEDSPNCYWDAGQFGNGQGHSFYSIRVGNRDCVVYMNRRYNRHHGQCYPR